MEKEMQAKTLIVVLEEMEDFVNHIYNLIEDKKIERACFCLGVLVGKIHQIREDLVFEQYTKNKEKNDGQENQS